MSNFQGKIITSFALIPTHRQVEFESRFNKLAKKAEKLNCYIPQFRIIGSKVVTRNNSKILCNEIEYIYSDIKLADYTLIASLEHTPEGNIIKNFTNNDIPLQYRSSTHCDHCNTNRQRKNTYILLHDDNTYKQVGSTCLKDFVGHDVSQATYYAELINGIKELEREFYGSTDDSGKYVELHSFLSYVVQCINEHGWVSSGKAKSQLEEDFALVPTYVRALKLYDRSLHTQIPSIVNEAIEWCSNLSDEYVETNDYLYNLRVVSRLEVFLRKNAALCASIIIAYQNAQKETQNNNSNYVGNIGERTTFELKVNKVIDLGYRQYGSMITHSTLHIMSDKDGNVFTWASSTERFEVNESVLLTGTIKDHREYKEVKQTILTICKKVDAIPVPKKKIKKAS